MIEINANKSEKIDISEVYIFRENGSNVFHFVRRKNSCMPSNYSLMDIFSSKLIRVCSYRDFINAKNNYSGNHWMYDYIKSIKEVYPEVNVYLDGKVPKLLLQKLYYEANNIDEKVLKRGAMKD